MKMNSRNTALNDVLVHA